MSVNFSTPTNSSLSSEQGDCTFSVLIMSIGTSFHITRVLLFLPLSVLVLYLGAQRWREKRSFATESHSDIFTYHMAALELIWVLGLVCYYYDVFKGAKSDATTVVRFTFGMTWYGETVFHVLTCVERYLAVVHPITYRLQKDGRGVRIRNISIGCAWLFSVLLCIVVSFQPTSNELILILCPLLTSVVLVSFCSLSVLCVLSRPGPGEGGRNKGRADQVKQRAFFTILAVTGVQWLWFLGVIVSYSLRSSPLLSPDIGCLAVTAAMWLNLPSSLVLPLLYLQRAGKPAFCFRNTQAK